MLCVAVRGVIVGSVLATFPTVLLGLCSGWLLPGTPVWVDILSYSYEQGPSGRPH